MVLPPVKRTSTFRGEERDGGPPACEATSAVSGCAPRAMSGYCGDTDPRVEARQGENAMLTVLCRMLLGAGAGLMLAAGAAQAADDIEAKAQTCAACHGETGTPTDPKIMPIIWGQQES